MKSKKMKGTVGRSDLEGGFLTFDADGQTYKLEGGGKDLRPGVTAEIEGAVESGGFGIGFGTPTLKVKSYKVM